MAAAVDRRGAGRRLHHGQGEGHLPQRQVGDLRPQVPQARRHDGRGRWQRRRRPRRFARHRPHRQLRADGLRRPGRQLADRHPRPPGGRPAPRPRPRARDPVRVPGAAPELPGRHHLRQLLVQAPRRHGTRPGSTRTSARVRSRSRATRTSTSPASRAAGSTVPPRSRRGTRTSRRRSTSPTRRSARAAAPKAADSDDSTDIDGFSRAWFGNAATANPYDYGLVPEVKVRRDGTTSVVKHRALGRFARELADVMARRPHRYIGGTTAPTPASSCSSPTRRGPLGGHALRREVDPGERGERRERQPPWIRLGHAEDEEIQVLVDGGIRFATSSTSPTSTRPTPPTRR